MLYSYSASDSWLSYSDIYQNDSLSHKLPLRVKAPLTGTGPVGRFLRSSVLSLRKLRNCPEMVTISFLALLLPV